MNSHKYRYLHHFLKQLKFGPLPREDHEWLRGVLDKWSDIDRMNWDFWRYAKNPDGSRMYE